MRRYGTLVLAGLAAAMVFAALAAPPAAPRTSDDLTAPLAMGAVFSDANRAYESEDFTNAAVGYQRLVAAGVRDARVFYNLGNAYYRLGKIGLAILSYERALKLTPGDVRIRENLEHVAGRRVDQVGTEAEEQGPLAALAEWHERLSPGLVTLLFLVGWMSFNACLGVAIFAADHQVRRIGAYALAASFTVVLVLATLLGPLIYRRDALVRAIVVQERIDLQSTPGGGVTLTTVHEGLEVRVRRTRGEWLEVSLPNGMRGWVARESVGII